MLRKLKPSPAMAVAVCALFLALAGSAVAAGIVPLAKRALSADNAKLLVSGRADFAVMDISDFGIARERGLDLVPIAAIVQLPLASVIARDPNEIRTPADLAGKTVGVTGVPSDDAVLDTVLRAGGVDPSSVHRVTIGFNAVADLAAGKVDAATAFWNAEGIALERLGIPIRVFRVDDYGAPRYPELVLVTSSDQLSREPALVQALVRATREGEAFVVAHPSAALDDLLGATSGLDREEQRAQLHALLRAHAFDTREGFDSRTLTALGQWDFEHGIVDHPIDLSAAFPG